MRDGVVKFALLALVSTFLGVEGEQRALVFAHGMGDSCFNPGMAEVTALAGKRVGAYSVCFGGAGNQPMDTVNGFFMSMNELVDVFAESVSKDPALANGFDAAGLSQGNLIIRGYIERYNNPPVKRFLSIHGPMAGVGSLPRCDPESFAAYLCRKMTDLVGQVAYTSAVQKHITQSNYLKDPEELKSYLAANTFLPELNNEVPHPDSNAFKKNFESLEKLILVKALSDTMIEPSESEWFGFYEDGGFSKILAYNETALYKNNAFGLKTLVESGRVAFETSTGDHLRFTLDDLYSWLDKYIKTSEDEPIAVAL